MEAELLRATPGLQLLLVPLQGRDRLLPHGSMLELAQPCTDVPNPRLSENLERFSNPGT